MGEVLPENVEGLVAKLFLPIMPSSDDFYRGFLPTALKLCEIYIPTSCDQLWDKFWTSLQSNWACYRVSWNMAKSTKRISRVSKFP